MMPQGQKIAYARQLGSQQAEGTQCRARADCCSASNMHLLLSLMDRILRDLWDILMLWIVTHDLKLELPKFNQFSPEPEARRKDPESKNRVCALKLRRWACETAL